jgi:hypothetical protein
MLRSVAPSPTALKAQNETAVLDGLGSTFEIFAAKLKLIQQIEKIMQNMLSVLSFIFHRQWALLSSAACLVSVARNMPASGWLGWAYLGGALALVVIALVSMQRQAFSGRFGHRFPGASAAVFSVAPIGAVTIVASLVQQMS